MLCDNCGEYEASIKLTQIINGKKTEMMICEECGQKMGVSDIDFEMPIDISDFLGNFEFDNDNFMPFKINNQEVRCQKCDMTYQDFLNNGKFGCEECYNTFENKINILLKRIQGTDKYLGRKAGHNEDNNVPEVKSNKRLEELQKKLKLSIKEERYEDAAKLRDEIKNINQDE